MWNESSLAKYIHNVKITNEISFRNTLRYLITIVQEFFANCKKTL